MERYVLHVTKECNCQCLYCYEQDKLSKYTWEGIKEFLDNILKFNTQFELEFLGGEPLLAFDLIKKTIEYLDDKADVRRYYFTTNGTLVDDEIVDFILKRPNIQLAISLDGPRFMNSLRITKEGRNTFDIFMEKLELLKKIPQDQLFIHMTLHPYNIGYLLEGVKKLYDLGLRNLDMGIIEATMGIDDFFIKTAMEKFRILSHRINDGLYPGLDVFILTHEMDYSGRRTYLHDESGKVIGESYGRAEGDVTSSNLYEGRRIQEPDTPIIRLKKAIYQQHQDIIRNRRN